MNSLADGTINKYAYPIDLKMIKFMTYLESPAHKGRLRYSVDFVTDEETPVYAAKEGIVTAVKQDSSIGDVGEEFDKYGNFIEIKHENNEYSIYEHIRKDSSKVKVGDKVSKGQLICHSGATGWLAHLGPHLHFSINKYYGEGTEDYEALRIKWEDGNEGPLRE